MSIPLYLQVIAEAMTDDRKAHQRVHDHLAGVLDATVAAKHGDESARLVALVEAELGEAGMAIAKKHAVKLAAAHDESAKQLGMTCEGAYNTQLGIDPNADPDGDGIPDALDPQDDGEESARKGAKTLTEAEMIAALKAKGYAIPEKKTPEQALQESFDAKIAALEAKIAAMAPTTNTPPPPQRQTQVKSQLEEAGDALERETVYEDGDYLTGLLKPTNWKALADPRVPWPESLEPELALSELAPFLSYGILATQEVAKGRNLRDAINAGIYS